MNPVFISVTTKIGEPTRVVKLLCGLISSGNLTEVNASDVEDQADLESRVKAAAFLGTLQAGYSDFHYLREVAKDHRKGRITRCP